jgi:hypothetical protein
VNTPFVDAGTGGEICAGGAIRLQASAGLQYQWSPATDLSCSDCASPVARPQTTTLYRLTATAPDGCIAIDSVLVTVRPAEIIRGHIDRTLRTSPIEPIVVPIILDDTPPSTTTDTLVLTFGFDAAIFRFEGFESKGLLANGWTATIVRNDPGEIEVKVIAPPGVTLTSSGELLHVRLRPFLGPVATSELPFSIRFNDPCLRFESSPGLVSHDIDGEDIARRKRSQSIQSSDTDSILDCLR